MKKEILFLLAISFFISGCLKEKRDDCHPAKISSAREEAKEIKVTYDSLYQRNYYTIESGENIVFKYHHTGAHCDNVDDDSWAETLAFEIEKGVTEFKFIDSEITETKCFYREYGAWVRGTRYPVREGTIRGRKVSEKKWEVNVAVITTPVHPDDKPKVIRFNRMFQ